MEKVDHVQKAGYQTIYDPNFMKVEGNIPKC